VELEDELLELDDELLELDDGLSLELDDPPELSEPATFFFLPDLKSVSYQPPPLRRKPPADIFLIRLSVLHAGHSFIASSLRL